MVASEAHSIGSSIPSRPPRPSGDSRDRIAIQEKDRRAGQRWKARMLEGDFEGAWRESDSIRLRGLDDPHRLWDGDSLEGRRVVVRCLHGLGDAIQFLRYASLLQRVAREVIVEVPPPLLELAPYIEHVTKVVSWGECAPRSPIEWDKQIEVMELPYYFRTQQFDLPITARYIRLPEKIYGDITQGMGDPTQPRIGVVWAAGDWNPARSVPFPSIKRLLEIPGCEFWNLQGGFAHDAWFSLPGNKRFRDVAECGDGVVTLAAVISQLDLVVTVDTLAAHLAGAIGIPAWVLLERDADWRWMSNRSETPWYPTLRLYRQAEQADWDSLISIVSEQLKVHLG